MLDTLSIVLRAISFVAIFQATGVAIFVALFERRLAVATVQWLLRSGVAAALMALAMVVGHSVLEPARLGGVLSGFLDSGLRQIVLDSPLADAFAWRVVGLLLLVVGLARGGASLRVLALPGVLCELLAFTQAGHTASHAPRVVLAGLLLVHIGVVAFWFGSLLPLRRVALHEPPAVAGNVVEAFSRIALTLVPLLAAAGLALAILLLGSWSNLASAYGRVILLKITVFCLLMVLAAMNRWRLGPALASGSPGAGRAFARTVLAEYILIAAVLALTAALTTLYSPEP